MQRTYTPLGSDALQISEHSVCRHIADAGIPWGLDQAASLISYDLELALFVACFPADMFQGCHGHSNRVSTTHSIACQLEIVDEGIVAPARDRVHSSFVDESNSLVNGWPSRR